jgi:hypothetical protein
MRSIGSKCSLVVEETEARYWAALYWAALYWAASYWAASYWAALYDCTAALWVKVG